MRLPDYFVVVPGVVGTGVVVLGVVGVGVVVVVPVPVDDPVDELVDGVTVDGTVAVPVPVVVGLFTVGVRVGARNIRPSKTRPITSNTPAIVEPLDRAVEFTVTRSVSNGGVVFIVDLARRSSGPGE